MVKFLFFFFVSVTFCLTFFKLNPNLWLWEVNNIYFLNIFHHSFWLHSATGRRYFFCLQYFLSGHILKVVALFCDVTRYRETLDLQIC